MSFYNRLMSFKPAELGKSEFALSLRVSPSKFRCWELGADGRVEPKVSSVVPVAKKLGVRVGWLLTGELPKWSDPDRWNEPEEPEEPEGEAEERPKVIRRRAAN